MKKKIFSFGLAIALILSLAACGGESSDAELMQGPTQHAAATSEPDPGQKSDDLSPEEFMKAVKTAIDGQIGSGESILDVKLDDGSLTVYVDLSGANIPSGFSASDIAESRFSCITDSILELDGYDVFWETITVDFGDVGYVTGGKADVVDSEYGRYFREEAVKIRKGDNKQLISEALGEFYSDEQILSVSVTDVKAEVKILTDFAGDAWSEEWGAICENTVAVSSSLREAIPEDDVKYVTVYLTSHNGDIFLTVSNGQTTYSKYEKPEPTPEPTPEPAVQTSEEGGSGNGNHFNTYDNSEQQQTTANYVLNTSTMKFHYPTCNDVKKIAPENYETSNATRDTLMSQGYSSCGHCNP